MTTTRAWIVYCSAVLLAVIAQESPAGLRAWPWPLSRRGRGPRCGALAAGRCPKRSGGSGKA